MLKAFEVTRHDVAAAPGEVAAFRIQGYLDAHTAPRFEEALRQAIDQGQVRLVVDCGQLDYISSAGLGVLIDAYRAVEPKGGELKVAAMPPAIAEIFDILGFSKVIRSYPSVEAAAASFQPPAQPPPQGGASAP
ncbi:MAG: STAS domain-containing protein [Candidatus Brocadiia bacterium]